LISADQYLDHSCFKVLVVKDHHVRSISRKIEMSQALLLTLKDCTILHAVGEVGDTGGRCALVDAAADRLT